MWSHRSRTSRQTYLAAVVAAIAFTAVLFLPKGLADAKVGKGLFASRGTHISQVQQQGLGTLYFVDSTGDGDNVGPATLCNDGTGHCTLRAAIQASNANPTDDGISIELPAGSVINLPRALPDLTDAVSITGLGVGLITVRRNTGGNYRIFNVASGVSVAFSGLTISNGLTSGSDLNGGGINKLGGILTVVDCVFTGNIARRGGAISSRGGTVNITNSTFSGNAVGDSGGAIFNELGTLNVVSSTFSGNHADEFGVGDGSCGGGAIANGERFLFNAGVLNLTNSTVRGNTTFHGGGICNVATSISNISNSTITGNTSFLSSAGGGIYSDSTGPVNIKSSIVALSVGTIGRDVSGIFVSSGYNLIGKVDGAMGFTAPTDLTGTLASPLDPKLDPAGLQNNGGTTMTVALLAGSPAIDKGTNVSITGATLTTDQRGTGFPRTVNDPSIANAAGGNGTDIGAFEKQTLTPTLQFSSAAFSVSENAGTATITVTRTNDTSVAATVNYATSNGTGTAGADYTSTTGTISFANGDTSKTFNVSITNDSFDELNETVNLTLSNVTGSAVLGTQTTAVLTITDDDAAPGISIDDLSVAEGNAGTTNANFTVSLSAASGQSVTVNYATANGSATAGSDYVSNSGPLTFTAGQTTKTLTISINGDSTNESNETFFVDLSTPTNATLTRSRGTGTITNDDGPSLQFSASLYVGGEGDQRVTLTVMRSGDLTQPASARFLTSDTAGLQNCSVFNGFASSRCDYMVTIGLVQFAAGESSRNISIPIVDDSYAEGNENLSVSLINPSGASFGTQSSTSVMIVDNDGVTGPNPIDQASFFVRQHYLDFLNREPDSAGLNFWTNEITFCGTDAQCIEVKRINVSAAFFLSIEFQETGYLVERIYKAAYGDGSGPSTFGGPHTLTIPVIRLDEFLPDTQQIGQGVVVGQGDWQQQLENNKNAFAADFVLRTRFITAFPLTMTPSQFVDKLNQNAGGPLSQSERDQLVSDLTGGTKTRAIVLRAVVQDPDLNASEFRRAFVLMQYFGYLRRNPNDLPDFDYTGYDFWLSKLNQFNGNFVNAEMVKAFILSGEYRSRFGP